jgi:hypothetical protein
MNAEFSRVVETWIERVSVGEWSVWAQLSNPEKLHRWVRFRVVELVEHVVVEHIVQTCTRSCPPGYHAHPGYGCRRWEERMQPTGGWGEKWTTAPYTHFRDESRRQEEQTNGFSRLELQFSPQDPNLQWQKIREIILKQMSATLASDSAESASGYDTQTENAPDEEIVEVFPLPAVCEGDGVFLGDSDAEYSVTVNGREHQADQVLDSAELGVGFHQIELVGWDRELGSVRLKMPMSVFSPVEMRVPPVTEVEISEHVNGGIVQVELRNRSQSDQRVRVEMQSVPPGWMALCLGEPAHIIKPGEAVQIDVQVEEMIPQSGEYDLLPFTLRAWLPGAPAADVFSTFHVSATVPDRPDAYWGAPPALQTP